MKNIINKIIVFAFISLGLIGCSKLDSGDSITSALVYETFDAIQIKTSGNVEITYGKTQDIIVEGYENRIRNIENKIVDGKLIIDEKDGAFINTFDNSLTYYIIIPKIVSIEIPGSANVKINDFEQAEDLSIDISGSGDIDLNEFSNTKNLNIDISGSGDIKGLSNFYNLENLTINISGSGDYSAFQIDAENVDINISGSGNCKVSAENTLNIDISGSGEVSYKGTPIITSNISGSGSITNAN